VVTGRVRVHRSEGIPLAAEFLVIMEVAPTAEGSTVTHTLRGTSSHGLLGAALFTAMRGQTRRNNEKSVRNLAALAVREHSISL
jgi:hypothetical protein